MKLIQESPEHHFLTFSEKIRQDPAGWVGIRFALSSKLKHSDMISEPRHIRGKLFNLRKESEKVIRRLTELSKSLPVATAYQFADSDIIFLAKYSGEDEYKLLSALPDSMADTLDSALIEFSNIHKDVRRYQKLADDRMLSAQRIKAYEAMSDANRVQSIPLRRERREDAVVLIVEDDRFTASYTANILNKDYDVVHAKTGEEAISYYIEHAPDIVLLDIHLPGLNGHSTLDALLKIDPKAYVVMLSVDTIKQNIVEATKKGAAGFLKKPFSKERLKQTVEKCPYVRKLKANA